MTTTLNIIDTAVKIGLGAVISGFTTYFISKRIHLHELKKQQLSDKKEALKECLLKIDKCSSILNQAEAAIDLLRLSTEDDTEEPFRQQLKLLMKGYNEVKEAKSLSHLLNNYELTSLISDYALNIDESNKHFYTKLLKYDSVKINTIIKQGGELNLKINNKIGELFDSLYT